MKLKIVCPYCNAEYTSKMKAVLDIAEGSYTSDCISAEVYAKIDIICDNCHKLVYRKEITKQL